MMCTLCPLGVAQEYTSIIATPACRAGARNSNPCSQSSSAGGQPRRRSQVCMASSSGRERTSSQLAPRARGRGLRGRRRAPRRAMARRVGPVAAPLHRGPGAALHCRVGAAPRPAGDGAQPPADGIVGEEGLRRIRRGRADAHRHPDAHRDPLAGDVLQALGAASCARWACASARVASVKPWLLQWLSGPLSRCAARHGAQPVGDRCRSCCRSRAAA